MSTHLSYRRRYSEPEKPEPRFQWRLRVHSLMMDDNNQNSSLSDTRVHSRRTYGEDDRANEETPQLDRPNEPNDNADTARHRRGRFTRTKSEGHLKLRVRFSKFSDTSKSFDDEDDQSGIYTEPENRKYRSSQESGIGSFGEQPPDEDHDRSEQPPEEDHYRSENNKNDSSNQYRDKVDVDDGVVCEECTEASVEGRTAGQSENVTDNQSNGQDNDVSRGAIPKRYSHTSVSKLEMSSKSTEDREQEQLLDTNTSSSIPIEECNQEILDNGSRVPDTKVPYECSSSNDEHVMCSTSSISSSDDILRRDTEEKYNYYCESTGQDKADVNWKKTTEDMDKVDDESTGQDKADVNWKKTTEDMDKVDDIESMIESIIAAEEAMLVGKENSASSLKTSIQILNDEDIKTVKTQIKQLIENGDKDDENNKSGRTIERSVRQDLHRSSSLPSYECNKDTNIAKTCIPFSSSCPSSHKVIQQEQKTTEDEDEEDDGWAYLPMILLEDVFTLLTPKERHQASQVCRQWYDLFYSPRVWETFILLERTLTKKRFNLYKGYQRELCPGKTQLCFRRVGSFFKRIVVTPITDYFNLYEFLRILAAFLQYQEDHGLAAMPLLHTFDFTFACASRGDGEVIVHGTGGQILEMIKQLLIRISNLKHLKLNQLLVDEMDVPGLFDAMANCFGDCLNSLEMLNVTKVPSGLTDLARFRNLVKLTVSPQHLNEEVLLLLAGLNLLQLYLLQDPYTCECEPVTSEAWKLVREMAPWLRVYLEVCGNTRAQLLIQPRAPIYGVFLRTPYSRLTNDLVMSLVEHYSKTLRYFVQERLPRTHGPRGIDVRCDSSLLFLIRRCPTIHTLVVRERISTSTLILLASEGKNLSTLIVRRHGLIKRCDWPQPGAWTKDFYSRLKKCSLNYDHCTDEVCRLLRRRWRPVTDKQFMKLKIIPRVEVL